MVDYLVSYDINICKTKSSENNIHPPPKDTFYPVFS